MHNRLTVPVVQVPTYHGVFLKNLLVGSGEERQLVTGATCVVLRDHLFQAAATLASFLVQDFVELDDGVVQTVPARRRGHAQTFLKNLVELVCKHVTGTWKIKNNKYKVRNGLIIIITMALWYHYIMVLWFNGSMPQWWTRTRNFERELVRSFLLK